jgi:hypothetical protein
LSICKYFFIKFIAELTTCTGDELKLCLWNLILHYKCQLNNRLTSIWTVVQTTQATRMLKLTTVVYDRKSGSVNNPVTCASYNQGSEFCDQYFDQILFTWTPVMLVCYKWQNILQRPYQINPQIGPKLTEKSTILNLPNSIYHISQWFLYVIYVTRKCCNCAFQKHKFIFSHSTQFLQPNLYFLSTSLTTFKSYFCSV